MSIEGNEAKTLITDYFYGGIVMYRVLLVDDEAWALVGIRKIFKWQEKGFEVIGETTDPEDAFKIINHQKPDVVFTDIRMPEISGIELMKMTREKGINTEFIIVSGFAEFCYAQEALKQGAFDYQLKPLQYDEAECILDRLFSHLEKKKLVEHHIETMNKNQTININHELDSLCTSENFRNLLKYLHQNYNKELFLKDLSSRFFINETYCCELFKKVTGKTFSEYMTGLRIKKACQLFETTGLSVDEVAQEIGYKDYYYFNKVFKKFIGFTPFQYRKGQR